MGFTGGGYKKLPFGSTRVRGRYSMGMGKILNGHREDTQYAREDIEWVCADVSMERSFGGYEIGEYKTDAQRILS